MIADRVFLLSPSSLMDIIIRA